MDNNTSVNQSEVTENRSCKSINKLDNCGYAMSPVTPDSIKESSDFNCFTSPLTFASGTDKLPMKCLQESRDYVTKRLNFCQVKTKNDCEMSDIVSETESGLETDDGMLLKGVYESLLECIMSKQADEMEIPGAISAADSSPDALKTPRFAPRLTGIAEVCPGPPLKSVKKSRNIDLSLCRKLEFDF